MPTKQELDEALDGVEEGTSTGEANSTNQSQPNRQTSINWQDDPKYREQQAKRDREIAEAQRMAHEARQEAQRYRQWAEEQAMRGLEGEELLTARLQQAQRQIAELQRERELDLYAMQRQRDLEDIVRKTGIPFDDIKGAANVHIAWQMGYDYKEAQASKPKSRTRQEVIEEEADDTVDLGAGKATNTNSTWQKRYDDHRKAYNMKEALDVMAEAERRGVHINEW